MAKVRLSEMLRGICGRIGNTIYSTRNGQSYARTVPESVANPQTSAQSTARNNLVASVNEYDALTDPQKALWADAVTLLPSRPDTCSPDTWFSTFYNDISPRNYFVGVNTILRSAGLDPVSVPPSSTPLPPPDTELDLAYDNAMFAIEIDAGGYDADSINAGDYALIIKGRKKHSGALKYIALAATFTVAAATPVDFSTGSGTLTPESITQWRVGSGKDITMQDLEDLPSDNYELKAVIISSSGRRTIGTGTFTLCT